MAEEPQERTKGRRIVAEAKKRFQECVDREAEIRRQCLDDLEFLAGNQWTERALRERARDQRPALVVNRLDQFVQHISNAQRQNRVSARVFPVDDQADIDTAEVLQGVIRHIEYNSKGTLAYDTAAFYAVAMGFGYWRQTTDYCDPLSFDQEVKLERIANPFQVYLGPHDLPDGSDAEFGFVFTDLTKEEYEEAYPKAKIASWGDSSGIGQDWIDDHTVRIVEYYVKTYAEDELVRMVDGSNRLLSELKPEEEQWIVPGDDNRRETRIPSVRWYKLSAFEVLDETDWPIPQIPIIKVTGHELTVDGKLILKGMVRNLKDAQRQYNFMLSAQTEAVDSSKGQLVLYEGQEEGHEAELADLSRQKVLRIKPTSIGGQPAPLPTRLPPNMSIQAMTEARMLAVEDLKALTGVYDAALGNRSNETSGRGILARQQQSETANFHFQDNLLLSITHSTKMLVDLIGKVYDTPRVVRMVGEDDSQKVVKVNQVTQEKGQAKRYDLNVGKYDVIATAGPSFQTKRQEAADLLVQLAKATPQLMLIAPDIILKALDVPYAQELAERAKKSLPPNLQDRPEGQPEIPPQVQQQLQQMSQVLEALTKELNAKNQLIENKQMELDSKERVEMAKLQVERERVQAQMFETQLRLDSQESIALLKAEVDSIKAGMQLDEQRAARKAESFAEAVAEQ